MYIQLEGTNKQTILHCVPIVMYIQLYRTDRQTILCCVLVMMYIQLNRQTDNIKSCGLIVIYIQYIDRQTDIMTHLPTMHQGKVSSLEIVYYSCSKLLMLVMASTPYQLTIFFYHWLDKNNIIPSTLPLATCPN